MKFAVIAVLALLFSANVFAADVPACWDATNENAKDGTFLVVVDPAKASAADLAKLLAAPRKNYLSITETYTMSDGSLMITYEANVTGGVERQALIKAVTSQLKPLVGLTGVLIDCDYIYRLN